MSVVNEAAAGQPAAALRPYIAAYHGYHQRGVPPAVHRGLPSPYLTIIFTLFEPLRLMRHGDYRAIVGGLHLSHEVITHDGAQSGIQLMVNPLGARMLLDLPAGELTDVNAEAELMLGPAANRLCDRMAELPTWTQRFAALDEFFLARLAEATVSAEIGYGWQRLMGSGGALSIGGLAAEIGWSERHLANRFRSEVGLTPKAAARVVRFDRARRLVQQRARAGGPLDLAEVAAVFGFYDQPHLVREFRRFTGCSPTEWVTAEFQNFQAEVLKPTGE
ncbi:AraC family transcriptional regulator [Pseudonocardiaceae bacterium YIM PH 21723]|nr:AraC family transcriptional regulator [Pseudonocardiaceae bacterium YIM PH 21723]